MRPATLNIARSVGVFLIVCAAAARGAPVLREAQGWEQVSSATVAAMLVFCAYTAAYLVIGLAYIVRRRAYDRHIFPEGLRLEGADAARLGAKYLILASIAAFGATLIYSVILRGMRYTPLLGG